MTLYDILQIRKKGGSVLHDIYMPHDPDPGIYDPLAELVRRVHVRILTTQPGPNHRRM